MFKAPFKIPPAAANIIIKTLQNPIFSFLCVLLLILLEHRYWLYSGIYTDIYNKIGSSGDAYYNLAIYLQNNTNLIQGKFYSMDGDHFTWWSNIIAITGHGWAPSIIFGLFKMLTGSSIAAFNLVFFSNLILTQLGIFFLIRYWTKNSWVATLAALMVPLSQGWNTFYMAHIHASFYWWLPFFVLSIEKIINQNLHFRQYKFWIYSTIALYTFYWYIFADWHSFVFGSLFLIPYFIFRIKLIYKYFLFSAKSFVILSGGFFGLIVAAIPFVLKVLDGSKLFNATRDLGAVNGTNFNTERFLGLKYIFMPILSGITNRFPNAKISPKLNQIAEALSKTDSMYPDALSIFTFWVLVIIFIPWTINLIIKRGKFYPKPYCLAVIILISFLVIIGPYAKFGGDTINSSYLPHQLIHTIFYPLQAIRAVWRGAFVGYLAVLIFWSLLANNLWQKYSPQFSKVTRITIVGILLVLAPIFMLIQNNGFTISSLESYKIDTELNSLLDKATTNDKSYNFYIWPKPAPQDRSPVDYYHYSISERNNNRRYQQINWVMGGIAGTYPVESGILDLAHSKKTNLPDAVEILNKKEVNLILQENDTQLENLDYSNQSTDLLSKNWNKIGQTPKYTLWQKKAQNPIKETKNLSYSLNLSSTQSSQSTNNFSVNIVNNNSDSWVNESVVNLTDFKISTFKNGIEHKSITKSFGEPAFLMKNQGRNYSWLNKEAIFDIGVDSFKLFRNGQEVYNQTVKTVSQDAYNTLIQESQSNPLIMDTSSFTNFSGDYGLNLASVNLKTTVIKGGIFSNKKNGRSIVAQYRYRPINSQAEYSIYTMPGYIGQPNCPTEENYLPGDKVDVWCLQYAPQMNLDGYELTTGIQYQK